MSDGGGRSKRRCASRTAVRNKRSAAPSAVHYVGYVEDEETPEMIMRKFEEMERIMNAPKPSAATAAAPLAVEENKENEQNGVKNNGVASGSTEGGVATKAEGQPSDADGADAEPGDGLSEEQLMEIFKQTSMFNVKSALANNECLLGADDMFERQGGPGLDDDRGDSDWEEFRGFWSDDDDWEERRGRGRRGGARRERPEGGRANKAAGGNVYSKPRSHVVSTYNSDTQSFIRRNIKVEDRNAVELIKVPGAPIPLSWGRSIKPFRPLGAPPVTAGKGSEDTGVDASEAPAVRSAYHEFPQLEPSALKALGSDFQAVYINSGWEADADPMARLQQLPISRLCPIGFVFMWVPKTLVQPVVRQMFKWGYAYIENLTWVTLAPNHSFLELEASYIRRSHLTLYMFRKICKEGKEIELKHQRNPDVIFDCITNAAGRAFKTPDEIWVAIETLLPSGKGKFLELWGEQGVQRPGWVHAVETTQ